jgi:3D (Asp-Asp-Asp) domain-containing protein
MAKYSMKVKGKEIGSAEVYAEPHTMSGKPTNATTYSGYKTGAECMKEMNISVSGISKGNYAPVNPYGVGVMRGAGAATKGKKISGKMG